MYIYMIRNKINGRIYVGQTCRLPHIRFLDHIKNIKNGPRSLIRSAINKYGKDNFIFEILDTADTLSILNEKEILYIRKLDSLVPKGYNLTKGGSSNRPSKETKQLMSLAKKGTTPWNKNKKGAQKAWNKGIPNIKSSKSVIGYTTNIYKFYFAAKHTERDGFNNSHVIQCCKGKLNQHKGYKWRYATSQEIEDYEQEI